MLFPVTMIVTNSFKPFPESKYQNLQKVLFRHCSIGNHIMLLQDDNWVVNIDSEALQDFPSLLPGFFVLEHGDLTMVVQDYWRHP